MDKINNIDKMSKENIIQFIETLKEISNIIYNELGCGHSESIYHKAMEVELRNRGIQYESEVQYPIKYKNMHVGFFRTDMIVTNQNYSILLEFKSLDKQFFRDSDSEVIQLNKYMKYLGIPGILINFPKKDKDNVGQCIFRM